MSWSPCDVRCQEVGIPGIPETFSPPEERVYHSSLAAQIYILRILSFPSNTLARMQTELISNWQASPAGSNPIFIIIREATSASFALDTSRETSGLPTAAFQEAGVCIASRGNMSKGEVLTEILRVVKCQDVCSLYL